MRQITLPAVLILAAAVCLLLLFSTILERDPNSESTSFPTDAAQLPREEIAIATEPANQMANESAPTDDPQPIPETKESLIERLKTIQGVPPSSLSMKFDASDETALLAEYFASEGLSDRVPFVWVLARVGGEETADAFMRTLSNEDALTQRLPERESRYGSEHFALETTIFCMGLVAERVDEAMDFIEQGVNPSFWAARLGWNQAGGKRIDMFLAANSIQALGSSGRSEASTLLQTLRDSISEKSGDWNQLTRLEGSIVDAAFYLDMRNEKGSDGFYRWLLDRSSSDVIDADGTRRLWRSTSNGAAWSEWYAEQRTMSSAD